MTGEQNRMNTYQWMLRGLGSYLDQQPSCRITLTEVPDGFLVRLQRALHKLDPQILHIKREQLEEQLEQLMREHKRSDPPKHQGVWSYFPNGHQDFFRALGFELDEANAHSIFLDELEDGFVITYSCPGESNNGAWSKKMIRLGVPEVETILNAAFDRRTKPAAT